MTPDSLLNAYNGVSGDDAATSALAHEFFPLLIDAWRWAKRGPARVDCSCRAGGFCGCNDHLKGHYETMRLLQEKTLPADG